MSTDTFGMCLLVLVFLSAGYISFMIVSFIEEAMKALKKYNADNGGEG